MAMSPGYPGKAKHSNPDSRCFRVFCFSQVVGQLHLVILFRGDGFKGRVVCFQAVRHPVRTSISLEVSGGLAISVLVLSTVRTLLNEMLETLGFLPQAAAPRRESMRGPALFRKVLFTMSQAPLKVPGSAYVSCLNGSSESTAKVISSYLCWRLGGYGV